jgi:hypothetical protein
MPAIDPGDQGLKHLVVYIAEGLLRHDVSEMVRLELQASPDAQRVYEQGGLRAHGFWTDFQFAKATVGA